MNKAKRIAPNCASTKFGQRILLSSVAAVCDRRSTRGDEIRTGAHRAPLQLPSMVRGMAFCHGDENAATRGANFSASA